MKWNLKTLKKKKKYATFDAIAVRNFMLVRNLKTLKKKIKYATFDAIAVRTFMLVAHQFNI